MKDDGVMMAKKSTSFGRATILAALFGVGLASPACRDRPANETQVAEPPEASFVEQAEDVRKGRSDQIRVDHARVTDEQLDALDGLADSLRRINLSHTDVTDVGLARITGMRKLIQLRLASDRITDAGLVSLADLADLRHLHLIDAPIGDTGLGHLHGLKNLESLYLDGTKASDDGRSRLVESLPGVHVHFDGGHHRDDPHADRHPD